MTEIHTYRCDICGKDFNNKDDCHKHEMEHITTRLKNAVVIMDSCGEILSLDDMSTAIERSYAIYVGCKEAADILWELFEEEGYCSPGTDIKTSIQYPMVLTYNQEKYCWEDMRVFEEKYNRLLELKITAENAILH